MARTAKDPDLGYISGYHYIYRGDTKLLTNLRVQGAPDTFLAQVESAN